MRSLHIFKVGGNVIDDPAQLTAFLNDFSAFKGAKVLVHGGGKVATQLADDLGIQSQLVNGRRITDVESLKVVTMVYSGLISKTIVAGLQAKQCNAIGLSGADGNLIQAVKRPPQEVQIDKESSKVIDYGYVGDLTDKSVDRNGLEKLLENGFTPVFSAITHDGNGQLLNTNADTIASVLAVSMAGIYDTTLVYCFEKNGVLEDINDESSVIPLIDAEYYKHLKERGIIHTGMIPKLDNAFSAINRGVKDVFIGKSDALPKLAEKNFGTRLTSNK